MFKLESLNSDKIGIIVKNPTKEVKDFLISIVMDQHINSKNYHAKTSVSPFVQHNSEDLLFIELLIGSEKDRQEYIDYLNREYAVKDIKTDLGLMDANECRDSILFHAKNIAESDLTSTTITKGHIKSLRSVLDLFEKYNDQLEELRNEITSEERIMNGILIESGDNKRFMVYSHNFLHKALMRYMLEVYDCNDREQQTITIKTTKHDITNTITSGTFECCTIKGAFEVIKVHTA